MQRLDVPISYTLHILQEQDDGQNHSNSQYFIHSRPIGGPQLNNKCNFQETVKSLSR